jgi:hypothetical protein
MMSRFDLLKDIPDDWFTSRSAAKLFFFTSAVVVAFTVLLFDWPNPDRVSFWQRIWWGVFGVGGAFSPLFLFFGMRRYWARLDDSRPSKKRIWLPIIIVGAWWGACLYYVSVL